MVTIFLAGGGDADQSYELDKRLATELGNEGRILYIPIAKGLKDVSYNDCLQLLKEALQRHRLTRIEMCTDLNSLDAHTLDRYDCIYLAGGNSFYLMQQIRESGCDLLLRRFASRPGTLIYGHSAGGIILGPTLRTAEGMDQNDFLTDMRGLALCSWAFLPHFYDERVEHARQLAQECPIIGAGEDSGAIISEHGLEMIGPTVQEFRAE